MTEAGSRETSSVVVACTGAFVSALSTSLVAVAAPSMAKDLHASSADIGWVLTAYLLSVSALLATAGRLADTLGRRRMYLAGFGLFTAASAACGAATSLPWLVGARVVQGAGAAALMATGPAIITRAFPPERRARGLGLQLAATYIGLTIGPTVGGVLSARIGWQAVFFAVAATAAAGTLAARALLPRDAPVASRAPLDVAGAAAFALGLTALLLALRGRGPLPTWALVLLSMAGFSYLPPRAKRHPAPILPMAMLRRPAFASSVIGALLLYVVVFILAWLLPFYLQTDRGLDPTTAGALMTAQPAAMAVVAPISGVLADRFGPRVPCAIGMVTIAGGVWLVGHAATAADLRVAGALAIVGVGAGLYVAPNNAAIMGAAPRELQATAGAFAATARNVGMACGVALGASLSTSIGFHGALLFASGTAFVGALLSLARPG